MMGVGAGWGCRCWMALSIVVYCNGLISWRYRETNVVSPMRRLTLRAEELDNDNSVSGAEILLACRAYIQRKNLLKRKNKPRKKGNYFFLWDDVSYLVDKNENQHEDNEEENDYDDDDDDYESDQILRSNNQEDFFGVHHPPERSRISTIRSELKKKQFEDPEFRKRWYQARWGTRKKKKKTKREIMEERVAKIPREILESDAMKSLTAEEITNAIHTYRSANKKRSLGVKKAYEEKRRRKEELLLLNQEDQNTPIINRVNIGRGISVPTNEELEARHRFFSERSVRAYKTRLKKSPRLLPPPRYTPKPDGDSPADALLRVDADLDAHHVPSLKDIQIMLEPKRLARRRAVLLRLLGARYGKYGKCVPDGDGDLVSLTRASMEQIGKFVIQLMEDDSTMESPKEAHKS